MSTETASTPDEAARRSDAAVQRCDVTAEADQKMWQSLITLTSQVRDYVAVLGLNLIVDESEGYAFLKSREDPEGALPRLVPRRQLTFDVSLMLVLLRKRMLEFDTNSSELRLIMTEMEIKDTVSVSCPSPAMKPGSGTGWEPTSKR